MAGRNWLGTFGGTKSFNVNSELDRGYEAALLIQSLELEYYGDRPIRPDLELSVPSTSGHNPSQVQGCYQRLPLIA